MHFEGHFRGDRSGRLGTARDGSGPAGMLGMAEIACNGQFRKVCASTPAAPRLVGLETSPKTAAAEDFLLTTSLIRSAA